MLTVSLRSQGGTVHSMWVSFVLVGIWSIALPLPLLAECVFYRSNNGKIISRAGPCAKEEPLSKAKQRESEPMPQEGVASVNKDCIALGEIAESVASARDSGVPVSKIIPAVVKNLPEQIQYSVRKMILSLYDMSWLTPMRARQYIEVQCLINLEKQ